jgi:hypothetical protein
MADSVGTSVVVRAARKVVHPKLRGTIRLWVARLDNVEVREARRLVKRLRTPPPPDVLWLSDSLGQWIEPDDTDQRSLIQMVSDELGPEVDMHVIAGPGYHAQVQEAYLRLVGATEARPLVLHSMWQRGWFPAFYEHPVWGHHDSVAALRGLDPSAPAWRMRARKVMPDAGTWEEYDRLQHPTIIGEMSVGEYRRMVKNGSLSPDEKLRMLLGFHYGAEPTPEYSNVEVMTELGRRLRELGCNSVAYQTPIPVQPGVEVFGEGFAELVRSNWALNDAAYREGIGRDATILQTGTMFDTSEFVDLYEAIEHLNDRGRLRMAPMIADAVKQELAKG